VSKVFSGQPGGEAGIGYRYFQHAVEENRKGPSLPGHQSCCGLNKLERAT